MLYLAMTETISSTFRVVNVTVVFLLRNEEVSLCCTRTTEKHQRLERGGELGTRWLRASTGHVSDRRLAHAEKKFVAYRFFAGLSRMHSASRCGPAWDIPTTLAACGCSSLRLLCSHANSLWLPKRT